MPNSLAFRLLAITTLWTAVALLITGLLLSTLFRNNAENNFDGLLLAHAYNLMGAIDINDNGQLVGTPNLGDPQFLSPGSGWYWSVSEAESPEKPLLHSASIAGDELKIASTDDVAFGRTFRRTYRQSEDDRTVQRLEALLYVGDSETLYQVMIGGNRLDLELAVSDFNRSLLLFFALFGFGTIIATFFVIRFSLKPLDRAREALSDVRAGTSERLAGSFPNEIEPLAEEINALIGANRAVVERARTQVGNLAHALKTPLAVVINEARKPDKQSGRRIADQAAQMQSQIQSYLDRARIAAQRGVVTHRTDVMPVLHRLIRVMEKLSPALQFDVATPAGPAPVFRGEEQDLEEVLGNLLENASRFAKSTVCVNIDQTSEEDRIKIEIADDGPGLDVGQREKALRRGERLDESSPGSGLGLAIVSDIVSEYQGQLVLSESTTGGLSVAVFLPKVRVTSTSRNNGTGQT